MTTIWRLRLPVRCFRVPYSPSAARRFASTKTSDPLRILFCGSDDFSIASLRAVHKLQEAEPQSIASIDVVHRPGKLTGRGLKELKEVPIKNVAKELSLTTHEIDTFTGWTPPKPQNEPINLVIAVSFGKLVPARILEGTRYGGLNVHPSLLPDFHGPAPIHHTLLTSSLRTGVTIQTLHPTTFDSGAILAQTPSPGLSVPSGTNCTPAQLTSFLAPIGADMLVSVLRNKSFVEPTEEAGWYGKSGGEVRSAPMITKEDGKIDWQTWSIKDLFLRRKVLGDVWTMVKVKGEEKRLVIHGIKRIHTPEGVTAGAVGEFFRCPAPEGLVLDGLDYTGKEMLGVKTSDEKVVLVTRSTLEGGKRNKGAATVLANV